MYAVVIGYQDDMDTPSREDFERAVQAFAKAELSFPGWLSKLLTHPVPGLENYPLLMKTLTEAKDAIKVFCEVAPLDGRP